MADLTVSPAVDSMMQALDEAGIRSAIGAASGSGSASGTNTGDQTSVSGNAGTATTLQTPRNIDGVAFDGSQNISVLAPATHAAASKNTPVDTDEIPAADSASSFSLKKLTWANIKATLKSYFDTLYPSGSGTSSGTNTGDQTTISGNAGTATKLQTARNLDGQSFDGSADITIVAPGTNAAASKSTPIDADLIPIVDSAASNVLKKLTWANLKVTIKAYFDTIYLVPSLVISDSTTARTLALSDANSWLLFSNGGAITVTVPPQSSVAWVTNTEIFLEQAGVGQVTVLAGAGVTVNSSGSLSSFSQYSVLGLKRNSSDTWTLTGDRS